MRAAPQLLAHQRHKPLNRTALPNQPDKTRPGCEPPWGISCEPDYGYDQALVSCVCRDLSTPASSRFGVRNQLKQHAAGCPGIEKRYARTAHAGGGVAFQR